jgi:hypothetical protein
MLCTANSAANASVLRIGIPQSMAADVNDRRSRMAILVSPQPAV